MTETKRSALIGFSAWAFILLGGYHTARSAYDLFTLNSVLSSPGALMGLAGSVLPVELPPLARFAAEHIPAVFSAYFLLSLAFCVTGFGLLFRKAWGLVSAQWLFGLGVACCFAVLLVPGLLAPAPFVSEGVDVTPEFNAAVRTMRTGLRISAAVLGTILFLAARRCGRAEIRKEFGIH